ncbi:MAG: RagB/SusD family nutrient uptake outer membrane protein [Mangrovibacterium sp.]
MKKFIYTLVSLGMFISCADLKEDTYTFISPEGYYNTQEDLEKALISVYDGYQEAFVIYYKYIQQLEVLTEFGSPAYAKDDLQLWNVWSNANNADVMTFGNWDDAYSLVNKANIVLGRGEAIAMDETLKKRYFAEARFLRAAAYFNLVRLFGGLPLPQTYTSGAKDLEIARSSVEDTYAYIVEDLKFASANLPLKSVYGATESWRISKGAAQALLGDVYLTMGDMFEDVSYYPLAKAELKAVIESGEYQLEADFKNLWHWWNTGNKNGVESVFEVQFGNYGSEYNNLHVMFGVNITEYTIGCYMYRRYGPSLQHYLSYADADLRKEATFLTEFNQTEKGNPNNVQAVLKFNPDDNGYYPGTDGWKTASPGNIKYYDRTEESATNKKPRANFYVIRYADVLLNYAEVENYINGATADAYEKLNAVRTRAGLQVLASGLSALEFSDALYAERGFELVGEAQLYYDELRTDRIGENVANHIAWSLDRNNTEANTKGVYMYTPLNFVPSKNYLFKIPQYDLDSNKALVQNPDNVSK